MADLVPDGIHFNLPAPAYHGDPAFGSSSQKALAVDPVEFQHERLRPKATDEDETTALIWGRAIHARVLEGRAALASEFAAIPRIADHLGALVTMNDLRLAQKNLGMRGGTKKEDVAAMIREHDPAAVLWDDILKVFYDGLAGRTPIKAEFLEEIENAALWMQADGKISAVMADGTFVGGAPEVSIFYRDRGVRLKARIDYMMPNSAIIDLKSFRPSLTHKTLEGAALAAIMNQRYDLQRASYINAWREGRALAAAGAVFGEQPYRGFLADVYGSDDPNWLWVMTKAVGAPQPIVFEWPSDHHSFAADRANEEIERGIAAYIENVATIGEDKPWPPRHPVVTLDDTSFPAWFGRQ